MQKITILMAAMLAAATVLAAGLVVFPGSVQEAKANPCSTTSHGGSADGLTVPSGGDTDIDCEFSGIGSLEIDEGSG